MGPKQPKYFCKAPSPRFCYNSKGKLDQHVVPSIQAWKTSPGRGPAGQTHEFQDQRAH